MVQENLKTMPSMGFVEATKNGFKNVFNPNGRLGRADYWWWFLLVLLMNGVLGIVMLGMHYESKWGTLICDSAIMLFPVVFLLCAQIRRFHDIGRSALVPFLANVSYVILIALFAYYGIETWGADDREIVQKYDMLFSLHISLCVFILLSAIFGILLFIGTLLKSKD